MSIDQPLSKDPDTAAAILAALEEKDKTLCSYLTCQELRQVTTGTGRPSAYCQNPEHNPVSNHRARQHLKATVASVTGEAASKPPSPAGITTVESLRNAVVGRITQLQRDMERYLTALSEMADPDLSAAQIQAAGDRAEARVAEALQRVSTERSLRLAADTARQVAQEEAEASREAAEQAIERMEEAQAHTRQQIEEAEQQIEEIHRQARADIAIAQAAEASAGEQARKAEARANEAEALARQQTATAQRVVSEANATLERERAEVDRLRTELAEAHALAKADRAEARATLSRERAEVDRLRTELGATRTQLEQVTTHADHLATLSDELRAQLAQSQITKREPPYQQ